MSALTRVSAALSVRVADLARSLKDAAGIGASTEALYAPDGSPVELFEILPPGRAPELIHAAIPDGAEVLELACGAGRVTRCLVELGHPVVAVDQSPAMLDHVADIEGAEPVLSDIETLVLGRRFPAVVLPSYLINTPDNAQRLAFLNACLGHVEPDGVVLIQRYQPEWAAEAVEEASEQEGFGFRFRKIAGDAERWTGAMTYTHDDREWIQEFEAVTIGDEAFDAVVEHVGLRRERWLDEWRTWALCRPFPRDAGATE